MIVDSGYVELLVAHQPAKPRNRQELAEITELLETLAANEIPQSPAMERFIETLTALILQYEEEICPGPDASPAGVLQYLMEEHALRPMESSFSLVWLPFRQPRKPGLEGEAVVPENRGVEFIGIRRQKVPQNFTP